MVSLEYIAGFFDGEGTVLIQKASPKSHSGARYWLVISIYNTHRGVMDEIQKVVGGHVIFHAGGSQRKAHYRLALYTRQAYHFLKAVQPYLVVKREQADIAIAFAEYTTKFRYCGIRHKPDIIAFQEKCHAEIKRRHWNQGANRDPISPHS